IQASECAGVCETCERSIVVVTPALSWLSDATSSEMWASSGTCEDLLDHGHVVFWSVVERAQIAICEQAPQNRLVLMMMRVNEAGHHDHVGRIDSHGALSSRAEIR